MQQFDFDSIEKIEFVERSLHDIKDYLKRYIDEIVKLENIKARIIVDNKAEFECVLVNRNKIATESHFLLYLTLCSRRKNFFITFCGIWDSARFTETRARRSLRSMSF